MNQLKTRIESELKSLRPVERALARAFVDHFSSTYGSSAYDLGKLERGTSYPPGHDAALLDYVSLTFAHTYLRDRFACVYCELDGLKSAGAYAVIQVDHLVPVNPEDMGVWQPVPDADRFVVGYSPSNLVCACRSCNSRKSNQVVPSVGPLMPYPERRAQVVKAFRADQVGAISTKPAEVYVTQVHEAAAFVEAYKAAVDAIP